MSNLPSSAKGLKNLVSFHFGAVVDQVSANFSFFFYFQGQHVLHEQHNPVSIKHKSPTTVLPELRGHGEKQVSQKAKMPLNVGVFRLEGSHISDLGKPLCLDEILSSLSLTHCPT